MSPGDFALYGSQEDGARAVAAWRRILARATGRRLPPSGQRRPAPLDAEPVDTPEARAFWSSCTGGAP